MKQTSSEGDIRQPLSAEVVATLAGSRSSFVDFLERRVGSRALAEDIFQEAFTRSLDKLPPLEKEESAVAWFYRVLRNSVIDHHRRLGTRERALERFQQELTNSADAETETHDAVCKCVVQLARTLKPEYAEALRRVEVDEISVQDFARDAGITANNAGVRLHRAREALRKQVASSCGACAEHGCLDCTCVSGP